MTSEDEKEKFELMERRDEGQIEKAILGEYLEEFIYDFTTRDGHRVTGLSWVGVKEIAARMGHIRCDEKPEIRDQGDSWLVIVKAEDRLRDSSRWGVTTQSKTMRLKSGNIVDDAFAIQKAMSKAQRNAIRQLIPEKWIQQLIDRFLKGERQFEPEKVIDVKGEAPAQAPKPTSFDVPAPKPTLGGILDTHPTDGGPILPEGKPPTPVKGHLSENKMAGLESPPRTPQSRSCTGNQRAMITAMCREYKKGFGYDPLPNILERNEAGNLEVLTFEQAEAAIAWIERLSK